MALQPCGLVNNIHEGKLYSKTFKHTAGASDITWQSHLKWLAGQINTFLNTLPDGYNFELVGLMGRFIVGNPLIPTTGTSHALQYRVWYRNMSASTGAMADYYYLADAADAANCHYKSMNYPSSGSGNVTIYDNDATKCIDANTYREDTLYYKLWLYDSTTPTE